MYLKYRPIKILLYLKVTLINNNNKIHIFIIFLVKYFLINGYSLWNALHFANKYLIKLQNEN